MENSADHYFGRGVLAVVLAPAFVATLLLCYVRMSGDGDADSYQTAILLAFFAFSYLFGLLPGGLMLYLMRRFGFTKFWHFVVGGAIVGIASTIAFVAIGYSSLLLDDFLGWAARLGDYLEVMLVGPLAGGFVWIISESFRRS